MSDNELASTKTASPNPLTYAELNLKLDGDNYAELPLGTDKYLYPYSTDDNPVSPTPYILSAPSRILGSSLSQHSQGSSNHDVNNYGSGLDRYGSLKRNHGSVHKINDVGSYDRYVFQKFVFTEMRYLFLNEVCSIGMEA